MEDRYYLAALLQCRHIGSVRMRRLLASVSSAQEIWSMDIGSLRDEGALSETLADALVQHCRKNDTLPHPDLVWK